MSVVAYLALGSNIGDRAGNLRRALESLKRAGIAVEAVSSVWETPPMPEDQPWYLNAVARVRTDASPLDLLHIAKDIERELGRRPGRRWGPRPIDVDILFYGDERVSTSELTVPHAGVSQRAFVLAPLSEVATGPLPVLGKSAAELLAGVDASGCRRTGISLARAGG